MSERGTDPIEDAARLESAMRDLIQQAEACVRCAGLPGSDSGLPRLQRVIDEVAKPALAEGSGLLDRLREAEADAAKWRQYGEDCAKAMVSSPAARENAELRSRVEKAEQALRYMLDMFGGNLSDVRRDEFRAALGEGSSNPEPATTEGWRDNEYRIVYALTAPDGAVELYDEHNDLVGWHRNDVKPFGADDPIPAVSSISEDPKP